MTITFSETPPVYSVSRPEQPVNPIGYSAQMRKFEGYFTYVSVKMILVSLSFGIFSIDNTV